MKLIGIIGGMSALSTEIYYRELCRVARQRLGGLSSPHLLIRSVDFAEIEKLQVSGDWETAGNLLNREALALERYGAQLILLATNTMHKIAPLIMRDVGIPLLHIADATARHIVSAGLSAPGLMATAFTMQQSFYTDRLIAAGLTPVLPVPEDQETTHRIIYEELCRGIIAEESRKRYEAIARRLHDAGADCLILGCTEVGMLLSGENVGFPVFDTTLIHCETAIAHALAVPSPPVPAG